MSDTYVQVDPRSIIIKRATRQRQENIADVEDLKQSLQAIGLINPIVVRQTSDGLELVAGERRLTASLQLGWSTIATRNFESLTAEEAEEIELEENIKRKELAWRDQVRAVGRLHKLYRNRTAGWRIEQTAERVSLHHSYLRKILHVFDAIDSGRIAQAQSIDQAFNTLHRFSERKAESIVGDIIVNGANIFGTVETPINGTASDNFVTVTAISISDETIAADHVLEASDLLGTNDETIATVVEPRPVAYVMPTDPVICANFAQWVASYNGPKFTLIHCDFPYGTYRGGDSQGALSALETDEFYVNTPDVYWHLVDVLTANINRIMSYSAHLVFWFDMSFYTETIARLRATGLTMWDHPIIWHKTGGPGGLGVAPGSVATHPRRTYDTALVGVRGNRPLVRSMCNSYAAPTAGNKIHPSQKPEPMLRYFLQMFVDETATVFDPTCGSAAALRAAEDLGAKQVLGLELDANYAASANTQTLKARILRAAGSIRRESVV